MNRCSTQDTLKTQRGPNCNHDTQPRRGQRMPLVTPGSPSGGEACPETQGLERRPWAGTVVPDLESLRCEFGIFFI